MGLTVFCRIFFAFSVNDGIFCRMMSVPQNMVMDLNDVMIIVGVMIVPIRVEASTTNHLKILCAIFGEV